ALSDPVDSSARSLLRSVLSHLKLRDFAVELWDGEVWPAESGRPLFKLIFRSPKIVRAMFSHPSALSFGEAYIYGYLDVGGALLEFCKSGERLLTIDLSWMEKFQLARQLWSIPAPDYPRGGVFGGFRRHFASAGERLRAAVNYHYDHPVDFWRLWLDESLCYSCAYFESPELSLGEAQKHKVDYICRKLRLESGQRLLDMGCGWGALIINAAAHYGVNALGITLSLQQAKVARERIRAAGLSARCPVEVANFLEFKPRESFDRIASVGAAEHVPEKFFAGYFARAFEWLRPGGQFLHHAIVHA